MKKIFLVLPVVILIFIFFGCSDETTSSEKTTKISTDINKRPDTLSISFDIQGTTYNFTQLDTNLVFYGNPKVIYYLTASNGYGDFNLYFPADSNNYHLHFSGFKSDSLSFGYIPWKYDFTLRDFTGSGNIKVVR
jgi:hypothetical protein